MIKLDYCTVPHMNCSLCSLSSYEFDCMGYRIVKFYDTDDIVDAVGATSIEEVIREWNGKSLQEILTDLDNMFPHSDNTDLAVAISKLEGVN